MDGRRYVEDKIGNCLSKQALILSRVNTQIMSNNRDDLKIILICSETTDALSPNPFYLTPNPFQLIPKHNFRGSKAILGMMFVRIRGDGGIEFKFIGNSFLEAT